MLILARYENEKITVGENIEIQVLEVTRHQVTLGVHPPIPGYNNVLTIGEKPYSYFKIKMLHNCSISKDVRIYYKNKLGTAAKLGIEAPEHMKIHRPEWKGETNNMRVSHD